MTAEMEAFGDILGRTTDSEHEMNEDDDELEETQVPLATISQVYCITFNFRPAVVSLTNKQYTSIHSGEI